MTRLLAAVRPPSSLVVIMDPIGGAIPAEIGAALVASTPSSIAVGTRSAHDGPTRIVLTDEDDRNSVLPIVFDGMIESPGGRVAVCSVLGKVFAEIAVAGPRVRIHVRADDPSEPAAIEVVVAQGAARSMTMEEELLEELRRDHPGPNIVVEPSSYEYFRLLERRYPLGGSKIDWDRVPTGRVRPNADPARWTDEAVAFTEHVIKVERLDRGTHVVAIGDGPVDVALRLSLQTLVSCLPTLLHLPQHTYALPPDGRWCLAFTMEGNLSFGYAPV
jgi:hypothetical protein